MSMTATGIDPQQQNRAEDPMTKRDYQMVPAALNQQRIERALPR